MDTNGAKPHTAKATMIGMNVLEEKYSDMIVDWSPSSPGLNLIENLWAILTENTVRLQERSGAQTACPALLPVLADNDQSRRASRVGGGHVQQDWCSS